ncbi:metal dependent amidohydrolase [Xylaria sp. FL1042]|nr:metal dependent amidohydrolase [Xylaria sp. FL1042]
MTRLPRVPQLLFLFLTAAFLRPASAECRLLKRGLSRDLLLLGTVLTDRGALRDSAVFIQAGKIAYVGDICGLGINTTRGGGYDVRYDVSSVVDCTGGGGAGSVISPGFINTHEHIGFSTVAPFVDIGERVGHRHDWRVGTRNYTMREVAVNGSVLDATAWGELRHVFSGTTSIIGGEMVPGLARNLDFPDGLEEGLAHRVVIYDTFPLKDKLGILRTGDCDYGPNAIDGATAASYHRYIGHIGEGVDPEAANEFTCLSNATYDITPAPGGGLSTDIMAANVALVHALGLTATDFSIVAARGAKVVWSPRSNVSLYGKTVNVSQILEAGVTVALGTDWLPSGSATMGREAVCAAAIMEEMYGVQLPAKVLWEMATVNAATVAGFEDQLGSLEVGKLADVVVFGGKSQSREEDGENTVDPFAQAIFAPQENIELVLRGGKVLVASSGIGGLAVGTCEAVAFGESDKVVCIADELGSSFKELEASLRGVYPVVLPNVPPYEPTCKPNS